MAEVRCPMCGKPNPPESEVCQFCQARITPLRIKPSQAKDVSAGLEGTPASQKPSGGESSASDWLSDLRQDKDESEPEPGPDFGPQESLPEWTEEKPATPEEPVSAGEQDIGFTTDWLSRIGDREGAGEAAEPKRESAAREEISDWLAGLGRGEEAPSPSQAEEAAVEPGLPSSKLPSSNLPGEEAEGEETDWLERLHLRQRAEQQLAAEPTPPEEGEGFTRGEEVTGEEGSFDQPPEKSASKAELPDWLASQMPEELEKVGEPLILPDWLSEGEGETPRKEEELPEEAPDWLSGYEEKEVSEPLQAESVELEASEEAPGAEPVEGKPDWLAKLEASAAEKPAGEGVPALILDEESQEPVAPGYEVQEPVESADLTTLPDWISQVSAEELGEGTAAGEGISESGLVPAELPGWLEAMRPVEAVTPPSPFEEGAAQAEKAGPLAGMRGALPAEPTFGQLRKPPSYSVKLKVTENQQAHIALLGKLLASEGDTKPVSAPPVISSLYIVRLVIAVLLFLAVLVPLALNRHWMPLPAPEAIPAEVMDTSRLVNGLNPMDPVLLVFDYEPGYAGEMEAAAGGVLNDLIREQAFLTVVSTSPTGPLLAERVIKNINKTRDPDYTDYADLGFIPGGATGLAAFAENPRQAVPIDWGTVSTPAHPNAWYGVPLTGINSAADFAMIVILTEKADIARAWIEQVQPVLREKNKPMLFVASAQTEAMIRPYYVTDPKQVSGFVSGLAGGAAYESLTAQSGTASTYWDGFSAGLLVVELLLIVGGMINLLLALFIPAKKAEGEEVG